MGGYGKNPVSGTPLLGCAHTSRSIAHGGPSMGCGERLSGLLKEPFAHAGRQLRPEGDELLKIGIDCAQFCAAYVVLLRRALW